MEKGFNYNDTHYMELEDLAIGLELDDKAGVEKLEDDWSIMVEETRLEPFFQLDADWITDRLDDERMSEDGDECERIHKLIKEHVDFSKVNELMPKLYYGTGHRFPITKADLLECVS